jgi:hypothetical protein
MAPICWPSTCKLATACCVDESFQGGRRHLQQEQPRHTYEQSCAEHQQHDCHGPAASDWAVCCKCRSTTAMINRAKALHYTSRDSPAYPRAESDSPKKIEASNATVSGWESMMTLPSPADVRCRPSARNPCTMQIGVMWQPSCYMWHTVKAVSYSSHHTPARLYHLR